MISLQMTHENLKLVCLYRHQSRKFHDCLEVDKYESVKIRPHIKSHELVNEPYDLIANFPQVSEHSTENVGKDNVSL